ncbi:MAG: hypothetical protein ACRDZR_05165, partial [Acidimicrobiales bacterium]
PGLDVAALGGALGAAVTEDGHGRYRVTAEATPALTARLAAWLAEHDAALTDLRTGRTLEEAYLDVVGGAGGAGTGTGAPSGDGPGGDGPGPVGGRGRRGRARR